MLQARITEMFGVDHPIVQGGLMWIANADLTSAVANAGAMGFMTALSLRRRGISATRSAGVAI